MVTHFGVGRSSSARWFGKVHFNFVISRYLYNCVFLICICDTTYYLKVYVMSRSRRSFSFIWFKCRNATRNGYTNVDDDDSDVSMAGADEPNAITSLLDARLHIEPVSN